jgi:5''/3''-nucleotidase SurE
MKILISNDDGIKARGIRELTTAMASIEGTEIYICAPETQQSGKSHSISMEKPMQITEVSYEGAEMAVMVNGTPADCVMLGIRYFHSQGIDIDIVYSGINEGSNLGTDTIYSGTVGAAVEGALCGKPSVAVSVASHKPEHFEAACRLAKLVYPRVVEAMDPSMIVNINTPNLKEDEIKGTMVTRIGRREYDEWFTPHKNDNGITEYWYAGDPIVYDSDDITIDVIAVQEGYASITPIMYDSTAHDKIEILQKWNIDLN